MLNNLGFVYVEIFAVFYYILSIRIAKQKGLCKTWIKNICSHTMDINLGQVLFDFSYI